MINIKNTLSHKNIDIIMEEGDTFSIITGKNNAVLCKHVATERFEISEAKILEGTIGGGDFIGGFLIGKKQNGKE